jgi:transcriptional regulator with XRE-family HTH domain
MADPKMKILYDEEAAKKEIWLQLAEARRAAGLTQEQLAERLGTTQSQVSRMEKQGEDISIGLLRRYVSALGKDLTLEVKAAPSDKRQRSGRITASI